MTHLQASARVVVVAAWSPHLGRILPPQALGCFMDWYMHHEHTISQALRAVGLKVVLSSYTHRGSCPAASASIIRFTRMCGTYGCWVSSENQQRSHKFGFVNLPELILMIRQVCI